jgi:hypothetical protein
MVMTNDEMIRMKYYSVKYNKSEVEGPSVF